MTSDRGTNCKARAVERHMHEVEVERKSKNFANEMARRSGAGVKRS
jgi:hypothetical protein